MISTLLWTTRATRDLVLVPSSLELSTPLIRIVSGTPGRISLRPRCLTPGLFIEQSVTTAFIHALAPRAGRRHLA
jgi:hypothetical protein